MSFIEKLKWFWDPRTDEQKAYEEWDTKTPLQKRTQKFFVYIHKCEEPFELSYSESDFETGMGVMRWASTESAFNSAFSKWLANRGTKGIRVGSVWYAPESIDRIELGEQKLETI